MSSSILTDENVKATPMMWRHVDEAAEPAAPAKPEEPAPPPPPDCSAQIAQVEQQWQAKVRDAQAAGFREGEATGRKRAAESLQPVLDKLAQATADIAGLKPRLRQDAEADIVKLALAISRRILRREVAVDPEALRGLLRAALDRLQGQEIARVRVHPSQADLFRASLQSASAGRTVEVVADPLRDPGDAVFETQHGNLDASVESQLQEIERGLADRLPKHS